MIIDKKLSKDLGSYRVDVLDTTLYSPYFFNITEIEREFGYGKNIIKLNPNYNVLNGKYGILVDITDSNKNSVYYNVSTKKLSDKSRIINVNITDEVKNGIAIITLVATTIDGKVVKYNHNIIVNKEHITNSEIIFVDKTPIIEYSEQRKNKYSISYDTDRVLSLSGNAIIDKKSLHSILTDSNANFNSNLIGRTISLDFNSSTFDMSKPFQTTNTITRTISGIINSNTIILDSHIKLNSTIHNTNFTPNKSYNVAYTTDYIDNGTNVSIPDIKSYLYIEMYNLKPNTGFIDSIGLFSKSKNSNYETFNLVNKSKLKYNDLMVDNTNIDSSYRIGDINSQEHIDNYISTTEPSIDLLYDNTTLNKSIYTDYTSNVTSSTDIKLSSNNLVSIYKDHIYTFEFQYYYLEDEYSNGVPDMDIIIDGDPIGRNGESLVVGKILNKINSNRGKMKFNFKPNVDANIHPTFRINGGRWYISDISIKSYYKYGFNPEHTYCYIELPHDINDDDTDFLIEFYNQNNNKSKYYHTIDRMNVNGSNLYVNGRDNIINGTLYIGDDINKGIQLEQHNSASIIRSYNFDPDVKSGFMLYSGSNPITESSHVFSDMGVYMQTNDGNFFDFANDKLDIDATSLKINGVDVTSGGGGDTWTTYGYISDGVSVVEGTNGTESIFTITGSHGVSGSLTDTTMSFKLEPIYDYKGTFTTEETADITTPIQFKQTPSGSGLFTTGDVISTFTGLDVVGIQSFVGVPKYIRASVTNGVVGVGIVFTGTTGVQDILFNGYIYDPNGSYTPGQQLFLSTSGKINYKSTINYTLSGYGYIQRIGVAITDKVIYINPGVSDFTGSTPPPP